MKGTTRAGCPAGKQEGWLFSRFVNELQRKRLGLMEVGRYRNGRIKPVSGNAKNDDSLRETK